MNVLIVEDEALIAMHLEMLVEDCGHGVCAIVASAAEAVAHAAVHHPDVALMDIRLSRGSSGIEAAREIYARHGVRCIFLSGNLDATTRRAVGPYHPIDFVGKPVLPGVLHRALKKAEAAFAGVVEI
jgi:DNA-binding NarL/FixJ family response regulator